MKPLKPRQQEALKKALEQQHQLHPLRQATLKSQLLQRLEKGADVSVTQHIFWGNFLYKPLSVSVAVLAVMALLGSAAFATENSIPGDIFHPVKLTVEKIQLKLASSEETKATTEAHQALERLKETNQLRERLASEKQEAAKVELENRKQSTEAEAKVRAEHALSVLENTRIKLETKGNQQAIKAITKAIDELKDKADESNITIEFKSRGDEIDATKNNKDKKEIKIQEKTKLNIENTEKSRDSIERESEIKVEQRREKD